MDISAKQREFEELKARVELLEEELLESAAEKHWRPTGLYPAYQATTGFLLGSLGAGAALLVNVIGAPIAGKHPLELIRVYLTFPLGEKALRLADAAQPGQSVGDGMILAFGCCLYLFTGMVLGVPFQVVLSRFNGKATTGTRLAIASVLSIALWIFNFYAVLSWLQPALFGGNWIVDSQYLPWWVAAGTHLVFGWTMALLYPLGQYSPYDTPAEKS